MMGFSILFIGIMLKLTNFSAAIRRKKGHLPTFYIVSSLLCVFGLLFFVAILYFLGFWGFLGGILVLFFNLFSFLYVLFFCCCWLFLGEVFL